jgi:iron uptake system component EfeO
VAANSQRRRFGLNLAYGLMAAAAIGVPLLAHAAGEPVAKPATYAPDDELLAQLDAKAAAFKKQIAAGDVQSIVDGVQRMSDAVQQGDIGGARQAWIDARVAWQRSEIFTVDLFPDFDKIIDGWPNAATGFHAVEIKLFAENAQPPIAETQQLLEKVQSYQRVFGQLPFKGQYLIAGMATLAYEMSESKAKGGESTASGTSLNDLQHNMEGLERGWNFMFLDVVMAKKPELAKRVNEEIAGLKAMLSIPSLDLLQPGAFEKQAELLAGSLADSAVALGWKAPNYTEINE